MKALPVSRACELTLEPDEQKWLIDELWAQQAVGILGGEPKCCKSFLALDMAVSVASGTPCLRQFNVCRTGPVLLFPAEDSLSVVASALMASAGPPARPSSNFRFTSSRLRVFCSMCPKTGSGCDQPWRRFGPHC